MIYLSISSEERNQIDRAAKLLLRQNLIVDINIQDGVERLQLDGDKLKARKRIVMSGKTKALLFPKIDHLLRQEFQDELPEVYAYPIAYMDWDQSNHLLQEVQPV